MNKDYLLKKANNIFNLGVIISILSFISCFLLLGYFNRHASDDFEMLNYTRDLGVVKATLRFYFEWEGALTPFLIENIIVGKLFNKDGSLIGFAILTMIFLVFSSYFLVSELFKKLFKNIEISWFNIFITSMLFMGASYFITPDIGMIWHWMVGSIAYLYSICLLFIGIAFVLKMQRTGKRFDFLLASFTAFLFGFTRLNFVSLVFGFVLIAFCISYFLKKKIYKRYYIVFLAFIVGFILYLIAPGNYVRYAREISQMNYDFTYWGEIANVMPRVGRVIFLNKFPYLLILLSPLIIIGNRLNCKTKEEWSHPQKIARYFIFLFIVLFIAVIANITALYISIGKGDQAPRVWTLIVFMYVAAVASWFIIAGYVINKKYSAYLYIIAFLGIVFSNYLFLKTAIVQYPIVSNYAKAYDSRVEYLYKVKSEKLVNEGDTLFLEPLPPSGLLISAEIMDYTDNYINRSFKQRYNCPFEVIRKKEH